MSTAGTERTEKLTLKDTFNQTYNCDHDITVHFVHSTVKEIVIEGKVTKNMEDKMFVKWTPTIKGYYDMYLNGTLCTEMKTTLCVNLQS